MNNKGMTWQYMLAMILGLVVLMFFIIYLGQASDKSGTILERIFDLI
jgi:uncharacterized membrane protein YdjX (TVP38/TMEM64 family)